jgi:precorrin-6B C5,15-methyltransferase / cobalt-precorrin-6B C5,C15-methyltransferase
MTTPWLTLIGIGEDGRAGLSDVAKIHIDKAKFIMAGDRHLALIGPVAAQTRTWPTPFEDGIAEIIARRGQPTCIIASGDPFFYGVGATLARSIPSDEMITVPAPSAFGLMAAQCGWALQNCALISLHGRPLERLIALLQPAARILALAWDGATPLKVAQLLSERGLGDSTLIIGEALGGPSQALYRTTARALVGDAHHFNPLNTLAIEVSSAEAARIIPLTSGLDDDLFEHDNQITKREIRAITLSSLAPRQGELLWDIGAGSGSIGIEWMLRHPANRAIAIEKHPERVARLARNAKALGVPDLTICEGTAPEALEHLPTPHAVFIGGGGTNPLVIDKAISALPVGGRLVANAVTLETQADLMQRHIAMGGSLISIDIARADPVGPWHGFRKAMTVLQWTYCKGLPQ